MKKQKAQNEKLKAFLKKNNVSLTTNTSENRSIVPQSGEFNSNEVLSKNLDDPDANSAPEII